MISVNTFEYFKMTQQLKFQLDDIQKITADDYTVQFMFSPEQFQTFKVELFDENSTIPLIAQFEIFVHDEFEKRIKRLYKLSTENYHLLSSDDSPHKERNNLGTYLLRRSATF